MTNLVAYLRHAATLDYREPDHATTARSHLHAAADRIAALEAALVESQAKAERQTGNLQMLLDEAREREARINTLEARSSELAFALAESKAANERLRTALQAMFDEYEGVDDMAVPTKHQSLGAKKAEALARDALGSTEGQP